MADALEKLFKGTPPHLALTFTPTYHNKPTESINPVKNTLPEGYVVVVTGASHGLGSYIARSYVQAQASGVIITSRTASNLEKLKKELEQLANDNGRTVKVSVVPGDATDPESYERVKKCVETEHGGRLDCLVCNAGGGEVEPTDWKPHFHEHDILKFKQITDLNYNSAAYGAIKLIPLLLSPQSKGRTIVNITSAASQMTESGLMSYALAKFALNRLTEHIGKTYADQDLIAISLHPGGVQTPGSAQIPEEMKGILVDDQWLAGNWCVWFSKERPTYLSGRYVSVNWDADELKGMKDKIVEQDLLKYRMAV